MQICHGGTPVERRCFTVQHPHLGPSGSGVGALLSLNPRDEDHIVNIMKLLAVDDQLPDQIIPFADDGGGDMMCLDYRQDPDHPKVVYWAHEEEKDTSIFPLADTFTEFLAMLEPPEPLSERD
jgi:hypothetical protein